MLRNVAEPRDAGGFEKDGGVEAAGNGAVDDGLLLLVEQRDHLPLRPDRALQSPARPVEELYNHCLLVEWRKRYPHIFKPRRVNVALNITDTLGRSHILGNHVS